MQSKGDLFHTEVVLFCDNHWLNVLCPSLYQINNAWAWNIDFCWNYFKLTYTDDGEDTRIAIKETLVSYSAALDNVIFFQKNQTTKCSDSPITIKYSRELCKKKLNLNTKRTSEK